MNDLVYNNFILRWDKKHEDILTNMIKQFNKKRIRYFILRNYEGLPQRNASKDVDIIIEPGSYKIASDILYSVFKESGVVSYRIIKYERVRCWFGIDTRINFSIHIDLIEGYLSKGFEVFSFDMLFENTVVYNELRVLNSAFDAIMLLYYKLIGTKYLKKQYQVKIGTIYKSEYENINSVLRMTLNDKCSTKIIEALDKNDFNKIVRNAHVLSRVSKRVVFFKKPIKTTIDIIKFFVEKIYRIIICPRKYQNFVVVEGPDGTGKSTFINGLTDAIGYYFVSDKTKSHIYHHRPNLFPNLGIIGEKAGILVEDKNFKDPHRAKPAGILSSFFRMSYYWIDYVIGVPIMLRKDVQFDKFTIYDRYIYDFLIDPHRSRINLPLWVRRIFIHFVAQPRIVFILMANAQTIYKRKQELTIKEINRQLNEFSRLAISNERFVIIDASQSPEEMVDQAIKIILERFTEKIK